MTEKIAPEIQAGEESGPAKGVSRRGLFGLLAGASALPFLPARAEPLIGVDLATSPFQTVVSRWFIESSPGPDSSWVFRILTSVNQEGDKEELEVSEWTWIKQPPLALSDEIETQRETA